MSATSGRRRRFGIVVAVVLLAAAAIPLAVTDPFARASSSSGATDNSYPTSLQTVTRRSLSSQTQVSATLGYAGSYTIAVPGGSSGSSTSDDAATVQSDAATLAGDRAGLSAARSQLRDDERLGCPVASAATVTSALGASSNSGGGVSPSGTTGSPTHTGTTGATGTTGDADVAQALSSGESHASRDPSLRRPSPKRAAVPAATTGSATPTDDAAVLSGTVDSGGAATTYYFEWGRTSALAHRTAKAVLPAGAGGVTVSARIAGLATDTTYAFRLVARNSAGSSFGLPVTLKTSSSSCSAERAVIAIDRSVTGGAKVALSSARQALRSAEAGATNPNTTFTSVPRVGAVLRRGEKVYSLDDAPVPLFYGTTTLYRALSLGMAGPDVTELQRNLIALGFGAGLSATGRFTQATKDAVKAWQSSLRLTPTGVVRLGDVVVAPGALQVDTVAVRPGDVVQAGGTVLTATSRTPAVTISLNASEQSEVKVGDPVSITLPNNETTPGVVSYVGKVATSSSSGSTGSTGSSAATITVQVTPTHLSSTAGLDQAPVEVSITTASVHDVLVVPVDALLALASGGYAVEAAGPGTAHHLIAVSLGLFDDAAGLVQVSGVGLRRGQKVVVPNL